MPQIVWAARPDGYIDYYNDRWYEFTGCDRSSGGDESWKPILHPDDLLPCLDAWYGSVASGEPYEIQYRFRDRRTGQYRWHLGRALPVRDESGRIIRWSGTSTDIDDLRRVEEDRRYLATIVESSGDAIVSKGRDGVIRSWNGGAERLFGYSAAEAIGQSAALLCPGVGEEGILDQVGDGERIDHFESVRRTKDGRLIDVSLTMSPIVDRGGVVVGISEIARDITERKEAEAAIRRLNADLEDRVAIRTAELERAKEAAEAASRAKGEFLANVSHEIRTPMNTVIGLTALVLDTPLNPRQREDLEMIRSAAESLMALIEDLLDFSRIESRRFQLDPTPFGLRRLLGETMNLLAIRAHAKGLEISLRIRPDVPDALTGDPARLRQVLINLVGNAIKFTAHGEVLVEVEAGPRLNDRTELIFHVKDSGIGIPADKRASIFQPFVQADGSTTRLYGGTGLGLAISSQLVELMGGRIWVESEPGRGSTFHFTASFASDVEARRRRDRDPGALRGLRTLVVDDNPTNRRILEAMLSGWGMEVTLADGAREAFAAIDSARHFDLIILDVPCTYDERYFETLTTANHSILIGEQTLSSVRALKLVHESLEGARGGSEPHVIAINRYDPKNSVFSVGRLLGPIGVPSLSTIACDVAAASAALHKGCPVRLVAPRSPLVADVASIV
ncbi:PAS domain S-box protein [Tautonia sociabilis]|uniref:Sensory/regulatory protein RpfC n=2 Tax=Tautonia sociabilis TaxID=2080755 RepID=A0A432MDG5_9BACT|nr:PAS domain S-box protein [Tautonia sociabilis]